MLVVNAGGSGVFRLRYEDGLLDDVLAGFDRLEPLERFTLVADTWACALAGSTPLEQFLALTRRLDDEVDPRVWSMVAGALGLLDFAVSDDDRGALEDFIQSLLGPELERVGLGPPRDDDDNDAARRRAVLIGTLGTVGADLAVRAESRRAFRHDQSGRFTRCRHRIGHPAGRGDDGGTGRVRHARSATSARPSIHSRSGGTSTRSATSATWS